MQSLEQVYADLVKRRANISKLGKTIAADKDKARAVKLLDELIAKVKPLVAERKKVEKQISDMKKVADDVKDFNDSLQEASKDGLKLSGICSAFRGAQDTPQKDFSAIWNDTQQIAGNNALQMP